MPDPGRLGSGRSSHAESVEKAAARLAADDNALLRRFRAVRSFSRTIRASEYHITNACNLRCRGCWFFSFDFDKRTKDETRVDELRAFIQRERERHINAALLIGGEPTLVPDRVAAFVDRMDYVTISTNGLRPLPRSGFERVSIGITLFGGGDVDDELRANTPGGGRFSGLFGTALRNYRNDSRAIFNYAVAPNAIQYIDETVRRIRDNGNLVTFNLYTDYRIDGTPLHSSHERLLNELLRMAERYADAVVAHPEYIRALVTGETFFGRFGYDVCPSVSWDNPVHVQRRANGSPMLPLFNVYGADLKTLEFCCTSGRCDNCRDGQAVQTWLLMAVRSYLGSDTALRTWTELTEAYWRQFVWSPYRSPA